jgi:hypothetical protein
MSMDLLDTRPSTAVEHVTSRAIILPNLRATGLVLPRVLP